MIYPKKLLITILFSVLICTNISSKTAPLMAEIFLGMDATETSDTTTTTTQPDPEPARTPLYEAVIISGESQHANHDSYSDYNLQDLALMKSIIEHELRPCIGDISFILPDTVGSDTQSETNTEPSQQNTTSDNTQNQQHEQPQDKEERQEKEQQPYDHASDFALEQRREQIKDLEEQKTKDYNTSYSDKRTTTSTIIKENDFPKHGRRFAGDLCKFDSDIVVANVHTLHDFNKISSLECIEARVRRLDREYDKLPAKGFMTRQKPHNNQKEVGFLKELQSGTISALCKRIENSHDIEDREKAYGELKHYWGWKRDYTFLIPSIDHGTGEHSFVRILGIDIMGLSERHLITSPEYIKKHTDEQSYLVIQEFKKQCASFQQKNDTKALFNLKQELYRKVVKNGRNTNLTDTICLALAEKAYADPINHVLSRIKYAHTLEEARSVMENFEQQLLEHIRKQNITCISDLRKQVIEQYGFDALKTVQEAYQSRSDYVHIPNQSSALHGFPPILNTIQTKSLPIAHRELVHLKFQITDAFAERNLTDPIAQQECLIQNFGTDVIADAQSAYQTRPDVLNIITFFNPIDVQSGTLRILETSNSYESVCAGFQILTDQVLDNARLCELECLPRVENHILDSLHVMRTPKNPVEFVFHTTIVDHLLTDLQCQATAVATGNPTIWEKTSEVFVHGATAFVLRLNPITQAKDILSLFGHGIGFLAHRAVQIVTHPIATTQQSIETATNIINFTSTIARFTADTTSALHYLSTQEGQQRLGAFCENIVVVGNAIDKSAENITAKDVAGAVGYIAGDMFFGLGTRTVGTFFKKINVLEIVCNEAHEVMQGVKSAIQEHPAFETAEGIVLKMSDGVKEVGGATKQIYDSVIEPIFISKLKSLGNNIWQSSAGILYVDDARFGNTLNHMLAHLTPNPRKKIHTVFNVQKESIIELIDEAWMLKGDALVSDPCAYLVDMKRIIGTNGETTIRIIVTKPGTSELLTAYPVTI